MKEFTDFTDIVNAEMKMAAAHGKLGDVSLIGTLWLFHGVGADDVVICGRLVLVSFANGKPIFQSFVSCRCLEPPRHLQLLFPFHVEPLCHAHTDITLTMVRTYGGRHGPLQQSKSGHFATQQCLLANHPGVTQWRLMRLTYIPACVRDRSLPAGRLRVSGVIGESRRLVKLKAAKATKLDKSTFEGGLISGLTGLSGKSSKSGASSKAAPTATGPAPKPKPKAKSKAKAKAAAKAVTKDAGDLPTAAASASASSTAPPPPTPSTSPGLGLAVPVSAPGASAGADITAPVPSSDCADDSSSKPVPSSDCVDDPSSESSGDDTAKPGPEACPTGFEEDIKEFSSVCGIGDAAAFATDVKHMSECLESLEDGPPCSKLPYIT